MSCTDRNCGTSVGKGGFLLLDDFEITGFSTPVTGGNVINMTWPSRDGRNGSWHQYSDPAAMASMVLGATGGNGSPDSANAINYKGGRGSYGATLALPLGGGAASNEAGCYDASAYDGISFWIKGNPAAGNTQVKFNVQSPVSEPAMTGGACTMGCYDHFSVMVPITTTWTRVKVPWSDLKRQTCSASVPATPPNFQPEKQILAISFQQVNPAQGFDFWIDDIVLDVDKRPATDFGSTLTQAIYDEMFKGAVAPYTYAGFVSAVNKHGGVIAKNGNPADNKHEAAAFLAQIAHETGSLLTAREKCQFTCSMNLVTNCQGTEPTRACTQGNMWYGRGAIQLTGQANYQAAQNAGFTNVASNPDLVATDVDVAFGTAAWFWTTPQSAQQAVCHSAILAKNFGQTTRIINGMECGGTLQNSRVGLFKQFCAALGINPSGTLTC
jgi:predicted chitinase